MSTTVLEDVLAKVKQLSVEDLTKSRKIEFVQYSSSDKVLQKWQKI
jgi:hypothetical protein